ncbi:MAG: NAD(P)/FAD-dependent oxidoreductase [Candidatus Dormibacteria bacterium]
MARPIFCIVGAGLAGGRAAIALRERGFDGRVLLIGEEGDAPYERPPLSKAFLSGELRREKLFLQAADAYRKQAIEWHPGASATALDLPQHQLQLADGELVGFDRLLLATGSYPRSLEIPGTELAAVRTYRTLADAETLKADLAQTPQVVVIGGGYLGTELACAARRQGCQVTVLEAGEEILAPLGSLVSAFCRDLHRAAGVELLLGETADRFLGAGRVEQVQLGSGRSLPCDLAVICVGAAPNSELAQSAGLQTDPGVVVGPGCQTDQEGVFAAGDVASWWSSRWQRRLRVEHYDNALHQGLFVAGAMLGDPEPYDPVPYFWTEQYGAMVQQVGLTGEAGDPVLRGDPESGRFSVFYLTGDRLSGCVAVNRFPDLAAARRLLSHRLEVSAEVLRDPKVDLRAWSQAALESAGLTED